MEASEYLEEEINKKIEEISLKITESGYLSQEHLEEDVEKFISSQKLWRRYIEIQCNLEGRYIGMPGYQHCPWGKLEERLKELNTLLFDML